MTLLTDEVNEKAVRAWMSERPRPKTEHFDQLLHELNGDVWMAEIMWIYWGEGALGMIDHEMRVLNPHLRWWKFGQQRNTIRSLLKDPDGKQSVWQMLHDAGAWL